MFWFLLVLALCIFCCWFALAHLRATGPGVREPMDLVGSGLLVGLSLALVVLEASKLGT